MEATQFTTQNGPSQERLLIYADLGDLPSEPLQTTLLTRLLQVSLFVCLTVGGALGLAPALDPDKPLPIVLWKAIVGSGLRSADAGAGVAATHQRRRRLAERTARMDRGCHPET